MSFPGRLGLQQRVLPAYRAPFFKVLAEVCQGGLSVFAGQPQPEESILPAARLETAEYVPAQNRHLGRARWPFYVCWQAGWLRWLERWQPDVLVAEANPRNLSTIAAARWMNARGRPVIGWGLGAPQTPGGWRGLRPPGRMAFLRRFDAMIAYSQRGAEEYQMAGFPAGRVFVAPNAVTSRPTRVPAVRPESYAGRPAVLFVGRLQARKRIDYLMHACAALPPELQPRLMIVGEGPARGELEALARWVYPQAEFMGGRRGAELQPFLDAADLFVLPGTGGLAVQEAMASGLPVIVAEGDGTQVDLVRPENGWQVPPGDLPALAERLRTALADPARLRRMGQESFRIVSEEANLEAMAAVFVRAATAVLRD